jgi:alpha-tubulin suppressor-like RCC1 family protein
MRKHAALRALVPRLARARAIAVTAALLAGLAAAVAPATSATAQGASTPTLMGWGAREGWNTCKPAKCYETPQPVRDPAGTAYVEIDASDLYDLAIDTAGNVWGWGDNNFGALGDGSVAASAKPVQVQGLVAPAVATATGNSDAVALLSDGKVYSWGNNTSGQLCNGTQGGYATTAAPASALMSALPSGVTVTAVAAGGNKAYFLLSNGKVMACGSNTDGQLGSDSTKSHSNRPVQVAGVGGKGVLSGVVAITSCNLFGGALLSDGTVVSWGNNAFGQLGDGTTTNSRVPVAVTGLTDGTTSDVVQISYGGNKPFNGHAMALLSDGRVMTWGNNGKGQLGDGTTRNSSVPVLVSGLSDGTTRDVTAIAAGGMHSMALLSDGNVMTWGGNAKGQLGDGTTTDSSVPVLVTGLGANDTELISAGAAASLAALAESAGP